MELTYQYELVREKEDELTNLKRIFNELRLEKETIEKVIKEQNKAL